MAKRKRAKPDLQAISLKIANTMLAADNIFEAAGITDSETAPLTPAENSIVMSRVVGYLTLALHQIRGVPGAQEALASVQTGLSHATIEHLVQGGGQHG